MAGFRSALTPALGALLVLGLGACVSERAAPQPEHVTPSRVYFSDTTPIVLHGARFFPLVVLDVSRDGSAVDDDFSLRFVHSATGHEVLLQGVQWLSDQELSAVWPANEPGGGYDLHLIAPDGQEVLLSSALTVSYSRASTIEITSDKSSYVAGEMARFDIALVDALGASVVEADDVAVTVHVQAVDLEGLAVTDLSFAPTQGLILIPVGEGEWVTSLSPTQENWLRLTTTAQALLTVSVSDNGEALEDGTKSVNFQAGEVAQLDIEVPGPDFQAVAGEPFLVTLTPRDEEGNIIQDREIGVVLTDPCDGRVEPSNVVIRGSQTFEVSFFKASGGGCSTTALVVEQGAGGVSESFVVAAGDAESLLVSVGDGSQSVAVSAGGTVDLRVDVHDAYNNLVTDYDEVLSFTSRTTGGELEGALVNARLAEVWVGGSSFWSWTPVTAGQAVLQVSGGGLDAFAETVTVDAGLPTTLEAGTVSTSATAGQDFGLWITMEDSFGNPVAFDPVLQSALVDDSSGSLTCTFLGFDGVRTDFDCSTPQAAEQVTLEVEVSPTGLTAQTQPIDIQNDVAATVTWTLPTVATAGDSFAASVVVMDAHGNPYVIGDRSLTLSDDSGTLSPTAGTLDDQGTADLELVITQAGDRSVYVQSLGIEIGEGQLSVEADVAAGLELSLSAPWFWVDEVASLEVSGVDRYGNVVESYTGTVSVSSELGLFSTQSVSSFITGRAPVNLTWDTTGLQDRVLLIGSDGLTGESLAVDAVQSCAGGPTAVLLVDGLSQDAVSCRSSGTAAATADMSASTGNDNALSTLHLDDGAGHLSRSSSTSRTLSTSETGVQRVGLLAVDSQACAQLIQVDWYVADSGEPAGPVSVTLADSVRQAGGSSALADTTVSVSAMDCSGGAVTLGELYVRTDLGAVSGVTLSTQGQLLSLVSSGATATWSASSVTHNGTASIHVGALNNSAYGVVRLDVEGESGAPQVAWLDPRGATLEQLDEIFVVFTEDMESSSFVGAVDLSGPDGDLALSVSLDGAELTIAMDETVDASAGSYTLSFAGVTDSAGNLLDGDWTGGGADFSSVFGVVSDQGLTMTSCASSNDVLSPDGNGGSGVESDQTTLAVTATGTPDLWVMEVYDGTSLRIRTQTTVATSSSQSLIWDARADDGRIVESGGYSVQVSSLDRGDNLSAACAQSVQVQHHFQEAE